LTPKTIRAKIEVIRNQTMKIKRYHISNLGSFAPSHLANNDGYVAYHASGRYNSAMEAQLDIWADSRVRAVRNAAITEQAERKLEQWRKNNG
jgi:hypothetical protein